MTLLSRLQAIIAEEQQTDVEANMERINEIAQLDSMIIYLTKRREGLQNDRTDRVEDARGHLIPCTCNRFNTPPGPKHQSNCPFFHK